MEKIKVNMSPNPLDVQTIHASQNDGEARQWEFELHNNGELIDTSDVKEQLVFKTYKGGTEQLLPENESTPTTSPFLGDIRYPQGLLSDQEFTYRQSPTEEDGLAKITDVKGNTLVWNQLAENGNFADNSGWNFPSTSQLTTSISNNELSATYVSSYPSVSQRVNIPKGHKFYLSFEFKASVNRNTPNGFFFYNSNNQSVLVTPLNYTTNYQKYEGILRYNDSDLATIRIAYFEPNRWTAGDVISIKNVQLFDLTKMGLDISSPSDFTSLFPLSYYSYNQGSLLSFNGNGIKTVGFNQWDEIWEHGSLGNIGENTGSSASPEIRSVNYIPILPNTYYYLKTPVVTIVHYYGSANLNNYKGNQYLGGSQILNIPIGTNYIRFRTINTYGDYKNDICLNISDSSRNGEYEPYTSHTTDLPISQYFPTGMKSAGNVYDELTENKAITRIGVVDLGTLNYINDNSGDYGRFYTTELSSLISKSVDGNLNIMCPLFVAVSTLDAIYNNASGMMFLSILGNISFTKNGYTTVQEFKNSLQGVYLYYELAKPTETSFTTASLVTENAEIPLSNEDGTLIGKCTEQLSENPGFIDAKIKLSDSDGECYSNKIQLHVERSPQ